MPSTGARPPRSPDASASRLDFAPLTPDRWTDLEALFGERGACGGCWCMAWRLPPSVWKRGKGARNRAAFRGIVEEGLPPGVLAYRERRPVGWCAVAPREHYTHLARSRLLRPVDASKTWSISCLFVDRRHRREGIAIALLRAAADFALARGAEVVEGYPVVPYTSSMPAPFAWTGTLSAFVAAGFAVVASPSSSRRIVRYARAG